MPERKTLEKKRRKQRAMERVRAEAKAARDAQERATRVAADWMRFVAIRFPGSYRHDIAAATPPDAETPARRPYLWCAVSDEDGDHGTVGVPDNSDEHRPRAARLILDLLEPDWIGWAKHVDDCIAAVAPLLDPIFLQEHLTHPWHDHDETCGTEEQIDAAVSEGREDELLACKREEGGCGGCEEGWACQEGDGPAHPYFNIQRSHMDDALAAVMVAHLADVDVDA